eukprot:SAG11_NODE_71_length_18338_cov_14.752974_7_plen_710_part_00
MAALAAALLPLLLPCRAAALVAKGPAARLRLVDESRFPLARCLDGSSPPFYHRPATSAASKNKWFIHHMGGDFCGYGVGWADWTEDCRKRANSTLGSSRWWSEHRKTWQLEEAGVDFFDADPARSPLMHDWNWVYLVYCDGHYYAGANLTRTFVSVPPPPPAPRRAPTGGQQARPPPAPPPVEIFFRGKFNIEGILGTLTEDDGLGAATDVVVGGCSSGGVAVFSNADHIHSLLPSTARVAATANSGYYLNINTESWTKPVAIMANLTGTLSQACVQSDQWRATPWLCIVAEVAAPFIDKMPVFAWQSRFDANQLGWSCPDCTPGNNSAVNAYGQRLTAALTGWLGGGGEPTVAPSVGRGAFIDGCHRHCGCSTGIAAADGRNPKQAFAKWFTSLWPVAEELSSPPATAVPPSTHAQQLWTQGGAYPCTSCCPAGQAVAGVGWLNDSRIGCGGASDDSGCSMNGQAMPDGSCVCQPQWKGPQCASLTLIATAKDAGFQPTTLPNGLKTNGAKQVSTWGGPVVHSRDDGKYHMFASTFVNGCNVWEWMSNSIITHAVSQTPLGPYKLQGCAMKTCAPEAHEGSVAVAPTGEYVLYFTSGPDGPGGPTFMDGGGHCDCSTREALNATCPLQCEAEVGCFAGHWNRSSEMATFMSYTPPHKPDGPWSTPVRISTAGCQDPPFNGVFTATVYEYRPPRSGLIVCSVLPLTLLV